MLNILIVDDEPKARKTISGLVNEATIETTIVAEAENVVQAVKAIHTYNPDLVLLDVEMPEQNGFALLDYFDEINFHIIFITASENYAINAFRASALDYILKPIDKKLLESALKKAEDSRWSISQDQVHVFKNTMEDKLPERIALSSNDKIEFLALEEIYYLKAAGPYTEFHLQDKTLISTKPIREFEVFEKHPLFFRSHRSYLINLHHVLSYHKEDGGYILLKNNEKAGLSRYQKQDFLKAMEQL